MLLSTNAAHQSSSSRAHAKTATELSPDTAKSLLPSNAYLLIIFQKMLFYYLSQPMMYYFFSNTAFCHPRTPTSTNSILSFHPSGSTQEHGWDITRITSQKSHFPLTSAQPGVTSSLHQNINQCLQTLIKTAAPSGPAFNTFVTAHLLYKQTTLGVCENQKVLWHGKIFLVRFYWILHLFPPNILVFNIPLIEENSVFFPFENF